MLERRSKEALGILRLIGDETRVSHRRFHQRMGSKECSETWIFWQSSDEPLHPEVDLISQSLAKFESLQLRQRWIIPFSTLGVDGARFSHYRSDELHVSMQPKVSKNRLQDRR